MLAQTAGLVAWLPLGSESDRLSVAFPTLNDSLPVATAAPRASIQGMVPDSNEPPATGVEWLVSPQGAKIWLSVWLPQAPGRIERTLACAAGAAEAHSARVVAVAASAVRNDRFKVKPLISVRASLRKPGMERLAAELSRRSETSSFASPPYGGGFPSRPRAP